MRVLLIEDEPSLSSAVSEHLTAQSHAVDCVACLGDGQAATQTINYDLILLDLGLPDGNGLTFLNTFRRNGQQTPVIILTASDQTKQRIAGLDTGADDYLVKPFDLDELLSRIAAVMRRTSGNPEQVRILGELTISLTRRSLSRNGVEITLTAREWSILECLLLRIGRVVSREQIEEAIYGFSDEIESNAIEAHISRLRKKLGAPIIENLRGIGYRIAG